MTARTLAQVDARLTTEITTRAAQLKGTTASALLDRILALEGKPAPFTEAQLIALKALAAAQGGGGVVIPPPIVVPPPPTGAIYDLPAGATRAEFQTKFRDMSYDGIRLSHSYSWSPASGHSGLLNLRVNRAARPLTVFVADGVDVEIDGNGCSSFARFGAASDSGATDEGTSVPSQACSDITFDGRAGSLKLKNLAIQKDGAFYGDWMERIRVLGVTFDATVTGLGGSFSHLFYSANYLGAPAGRRSKDLEFSYCLAALSGKTVNGIQTFHNDNVDGMDVIGNHMSGLNRFAFIYSNPKNLLFDGNVLDDLNATFDVDETPQGVVKNTHATSSGTTIPGTSPWRNLGLADGGGNVWA